MSCQKFFFQIPLNTVNVSVIITGLKLNVLYGVMICAVLDTDNLDFPPVNNVSLGFKSKANKIYISAAGLFVLLTHDNDQLLVDGTYFWW